MLGHPAVHGGDDLRAVGMAGIAVVAVWSGLAQAPPPPVPQRVLESIPLQIPGILVPTPLSARPPEFRRCPEPDRSKPPPGWTIADLPKLRPFMGKIVVKFGPCWKPGDPPTYGPVGVPYVPGEIAPRR